MEVRLAWRSEDVRKLDVVVIQELLLEFPAFPHVLRRPVPLLVELLRRVMTDAMHGHEAE